MRFLIYGAGAVGGAIGGRLAQAGADVTLLARGPHAAALREHGLTLRSPDDTTKLDLPVIEQPRDHRFETSDVVVLAVKSQDTVAALEALATHAPPDIWVLCAQNGVANEREALRRFGHVGAVCVVLPATHVEPGVVELSSAPITGLLDLGRYPAGSDERLERIASAFSHATFDSLPRADVMRWKYRKLLMNLANAVEAASGPIADNPDALELVRRARAEGTAVLRTANLDFASEAEDAERRKDRIVLRAVAGKPRAGGSSWQSLARGTGAIEADYLNGEITLLGRLHGVATPVNALLQHSANELARSRRPPGSLPARQLLAELDRSRA